MAQAEMEELGDKNYTGVDLLEKMIETANKKQIDGIRFVADIFGIFLDFFKNSEYTIQKSCVFCDASTR